MNEDWGFGWGRGGVVYPYPYIIPWYRETVVLLQIWTSIVTLSFENVRDNPHGESLVGSKGPGY